MALRRHWPRLEGAVGMWVWVMPVAGRCGSVSVWTERRALAGFLRLPEHVAIMDEYRERGTTRSVIREYGHLDLTRVRRDMEAWLRADDRRRTRRHPGRH
ncbi:hypothetical protein [Streptomyces luteogriseus]|uniref:hypothetical protein n=1 Tax=Streptomyces luteogriseus TaxID=68233 RepID=UPI00382A2BF1